MRGSIAVNAGPLRAPGACCAQSLAHLLAAMVPCSRLYGYLGCQMVAARPRAAHQYMRWAHSYSSAGYLGMVRVKETLLNRIGRQAPYGTPAPDLCPDAC